jgi:hypothetical protein
MPRSKKINIAKVNKQNLYDINKDNTEEYEVENILPIENLEIKELSVKKPKSNKYNNYNGKGKKSVDLSPTITGSDDELEEIIKKRVAASLLEYDTKKQEERKIKQAERDKIKLEKQQEKDRLRLERIEKNKTNMKEIILNEISSMKPQIQQDLTQSIINNRINEVNNLRTTLFKGTTLRW